MTGEPSDAGVAEVAERASLVRNDLPHRVQRRVGLIPKHGFGTGRRMLAYALVTWAPIAVWAALGGPGAPVDEPLLRHFGVHVRCLVAIPLYVAAEPLLHAQLRMLLPQLIRSGLVRQDDVPQLVEITTGIGRLRDQTLPWVAILALVSAWTVVGGLDPPHELAFAGGSTGGFGGWWWVYVSRPIYLILSLGWLWRLGLAGLLFHRIAQLPLAIVPTHPDRVGGLQFLERFTLAFVPVALAMSAVVASGWAHNEIYHGVEVSALRGPMVVLLVLVLTLVVAPLLVFTPRLAATKRQALFDYGALVGTHGRLVHKRWIERDASIDEQGILSAPELGPVADTQAIYEAVEHMRVFLPGAMAVAPVAVATLVPILAALAIQIPIRDLVLRVVKALL